MRTNGEGKPVVAIDIDGTLGDYHQNFLEFATRYFGRQFPHPGVANPGLKLWEWMEISQRDYRDAKLAYRQGGWKRWMPCYLGASELTLRIRAANAEVWICTTRPYLRLDNVDPDTREWLGRNRIQYDAILFDPAHKDDGTKYDELARQAGNRVASVIDDLPEMLQSATDARVPGLAAPILRDQPYNRHLEHFKRAEDCGQIWGYVTEDIYRWREVYK